MMTVVSSLAITVLAAMAACPLIACLAVRRRHRVVVKARRSAVVAYYTLALLSVSAFFIAAQQPLAMPSWIRNALGLGAAIAILVLALVGPFVALVWVSAVNAKATRANLCTWCGYNLTGNVSGVCPECGTPTSTPRRASLSLWGRTMTLSWREVLATWLILVFVLLACLGYTGVTIRRICSECCRYQFQTRHEFGVPFEGPVIVAIWEPVPKRSVSRFPLTDYLDPGGECTHNWMTYGAFVKGLTCSRRGGGVDPSMNVVQYEPDFAEFVRAHPDVLERIRASLCEGGYITEWLTDEYDAWKQKLKEAALDARDP